MIEYNENIINTTKSKLIVSYNNENIINTTGNGSFTLATKGKLLIDDININFKNSGSGETTASQKDVNFVDFDGAIRYSYSASEFANLTSLPANPSHSGLTAQGWNWSLTNAKAYVAKYGKLWVGQKYITNDGKTRIYIHLEEGRTSPKLGCCPNGTVYVDWGDGSDTETLTGTSLTTVQWTQTHNYATAGDYVITLEVASGTVALTGRSSYTASAYILQNSNGPDVKNYIYHNAIQKVEIGENISIGSCAFERCSNLASITIPDGITSIGNYAFQFCYRLASITIPDGVTSTGERAFYYCQSLTSITIPDSVTYIEREAFEYCDSLASITIPDGVTSIKAGAFIACYSLASITIPDGVTSIESNAFYSCRSLASITIPDSVTSIGPQAFQECNSLANITIPDGVTSIENYTFNNCYGLAKIRFKPTTPPTVESSTTFTNIPTDCVIFVPTGTLSAYTSATNYPDPATYTYIDGPLQ